MYAMKIVLPRKEERDNSSGAEAETLARGGRRAWKYSVQDLVCSSVWKIRSCHDFFSQQSSVIAFPSR